MTDTQASTPRPAVYAVTGANAGLGFETARNLARASAEHIIVLGCRNPERGQAARVSIEQATGNRNIRAEELDVSSLASVRAFATRVASDLPPIDGLVLNAGINRGPAETADGFDGVFETNHLGHFLLTELVLDRLAPAGRIIAVSSDMHEPPGPKLRWPGVERIAYPDRRGSAAIHRYSFSKLCNLYFVHELSRRLRARGMSIQVAAFNPGLMTDTNFTPTSRVVSTIMERMFASRLGNLTTSARALAELAAGDTAAELDGRYFDRTSTKWSRSSDLSYNEANARELWEFSERVTRVR